jgi:single-strand DNA-binding protein
MAGLPEITMAGTLTADPELNHTDKDVAYVRFTVACNDRRYDQNSGRWEDVDVAFLRCTAWRQLADNVATSLFKGMRVMVTGTLRQRTFDDADGQPARSLRLTSPKLARRSSGPTRTSPRPTPTYMTRSGWPDEPHRPGQRPTQPATCPKWTKEPCGRHPPLPRLHQALYR